MKEVYMGVSKTKPILLSAATVYCDGLKRYEGIFTSNGSQISGYIRTAREVGTMQTLGSHSHVFGRSVGVPKFAIEIGPRF